jgi:type II secretory pathway pseudopilin PulG
MKRAQSGFTVIEVIVVVLFLGVVTALLLMQRNNLDAAQRDNTRKTAINAMYFNLEEVFYEKNNFYPVEITSKKLPAMDPALLTDPNGVKIGEADSNYRYEGLGCNNDKCQGYRLTADLEKEAVYEKTNR